MFWIHHKNAVDPLVSLHARLMDLNESAYEEGISKTDWESTFKETFARCSYGNLKSGTDDHQDNAEGGRLSRGTQTEQQTLTTNDAGGDQDAPELSNANEEEERNEGGWMKWLLRRRPPRKRKCRRRKTTVIPRVCRIFPFSPLTISHLLLRKYSSYRPLKLEHKLLLLTRKIESQRKKRRPGIRRIRGLHLLLNKYNQSRILGQRLVSSCQNRSNWTNH